MSFQKAVNEIASLLVQGGIPAGHSQDIAARLTNAISSYYDSRQNSGSSQEITSSSSQTASFRRAFRAPEEYPGGRDGTAGADGQWAWAIGKDGKDGTGKDGNDGSDGVNGRDGATVLGGGGLGIDIGALKKLLEDALKGQDGKDAKLECPPGGDFPKGDICSILKQQANELKKYRAQLLELENKIAAIEKQLKDTVNCS